MLTLVPSSVLRLPMPPGVQIEAGSDDPTFHATVEGPGRLRLAGFASGRGLVGTRLDVLLEGASTRVSLTRGMRAAEAADALATSLPEGFVASVRRSGAEAVVGVARSLPPVGKTPTVSVSINDPLQHARMVGSSTFQVYGTASTEGVVQSSAVVDVDGKRVLVMLQRGMTPLATARAIEQKLPKGYSAIIECARASGSLAQVTIVHDAGIHVAAA